MSNVLHYKSKIQQTGHNVARLSITDFDNWAVYICAILNTLVSDDIYSSSTNKGICVITIKNRSQKIFDYRDAEIVFKNIYDFLNDEIILFKLEMIK